MKVDPISQAEIKAQGQDKMGYDETVDNIPITTEALRNELEHQRQYLIITKQLHQAQVDLLNQALAHEIALSAERAKTVAEAHQSELAKAIGQAKAKAVEEAHQADLDMATEQAKTIAAIHRAEVAKASHQRDIAQQKLEFLASLWRMRNGEKL